MNPENPATTPADSPTRCEPASTAWPVGGAAVAAATGRTVLVAGATGLVGREILAGLLADDGVATVHALVRRPIAQNHPKLNLLQVDFAALTALPAADECFIALGTTIKVAGSQQAFRAVDHDAVIAVARAAHAAGVRRLGLVSAMGADPRSRVFYNRVKGETEAAVRALGFDTLVIARPSFLAGDRRALGQPERGGEALALTLSQWLRPLIPRHLRSISAHDVAAGLRRHLARGRPGTEVVLSGDLPRRF